MAADNWCCKGLKDYSYQCVQSPQVGFHRLTKNVMPSQIVLLYVTCLFVTCHGTTPVMGQHLSWDNTCLGTTPVCDSLQHPLSHAQTSILDFVKRELVSSVFLVDGRGDSDEN